MEKKRGSGRLKGREIEICSRKAVVSMFVSERGRSVDNGVMNCAKITIYMPV